MLRQTGASLPHDNMQPFLALTFIMSTNWTNVLPRGSLVAFAGQQVPLDFVLCDGISSVRIPELDPIFAGVAPNLSDRIVLGAGTQPGLTQRTLGMSGGTQNVSLSIETMPAHVHSVNFAASGIMTGPSGAVPTTAFLTDVGPAGGTLDGSSVASPTQSVAMHNNLAPSLFVRWLIAAAASAPPVGAMVHCATALTVPDPGEMKAVGQALPAARQDLLATLASGFNSLAPDARNVFLAGTIKLLEVGTVRGEETHVLTAGELPPHTHVAMTLAGVVNGNAGIQASFGTSPANAFFYDTQGGLFGMANEVVSPVGASQAHENMSPFHVMETILYNGEVCATGIQGATCVCDPLTGVCAVVSSAAPLTVQGPVAVTGNLVLAPSSSLTVNVSAGGLLNVSGNAALGGVLTLVIAGPPGSEAVLVLTAGSVGGQFSGVSVMPQYANCSAVTATAAYSSSTVTATLVQAPCDGGPPVGLIVGLTVGICGAAIVAAILGVLWHRRRERSAIQDAKSRIQKM